MLAAKRRPEKKKKRRAVRAKLGLPYQQNESRRATPHQQLQKGSEEEDQERTARAPPLRDGRRASVGGGGKGFRRRGTPGWCGGFGSRSINIFFRTCFITLLPLLGPSPFSILASHFLSCSHMFCPHGPSSLPCFSFDGVVTALLFFFL